jgi:predicted RNA-binding protein YlqC (UPF0109 family)
MRDTLDVETGNLRTLVSGIVEALVDYPAQVEVDAHPEEDGSVQLRVKVAPGDVGKVIGKQGRTARSLRVILLGAATKRRKKYSLNIIEGESN